MNEGKERKYPDQDGFGQNFETDDNPASFSRVARLPQPSRYFGQPKNWWRTMAGAMTLKDNQQWMQQATFHRVALNEVLKSLGKKNCKHLIHVKSAKGLSFRAKVKIKGVWKTMNVETEYKEAKELNAEDYKSLKDVLSNAIRS